jgi:hypothetical protein
VLLLTGNKLYNYSRCSVKLGTNSFFYSVLYVNVDGCILLKKERGGMPNTKMLGYFLDES